LINNNIEFGVYNQQHLQALQNVNAKKIAKAHLKIDTGMSRLGLTPNEVWPYFKKLKTLKQVQLQGVFSHLAVADEDVEFTKQQIDIFKEVVAELQKQVKIPLIHLTNSAGSSFMQDQSCCNLLRLGLALYGLKPSPNYPAQLKPALSFKTKIIQIKNVPAGAQISYGLTHRFTQPAVIAVLPIGYADGYDRGLSGCGEVLIKGQPCPVRGRVCMNLTMVELSAKIKTKVGEEVVLIGQQGQNQITADEIAQKISTINYEIVTRINPQIKRVAI
ncbi:MAG: alanine racemase, partial [Candidatus Gribaldobacteria bacterium]|nr:alanine racemase [Candidatus Gribaldobacteria bacterium]